MSRSNVTRTDSAVCDTNASRVYDTNAAPSAFSRSRRSQNSASARIDASPLFNKSAGVIQLPRSIASAARFETIARILVDRFRGPLLDLQKRRAILLLIVKANTKLVTILDSRRTTAGRVCGSACRDTGYRRDNPAVGLESYARRSEGRPLRSCESLRPHVQRRRTSARTCKISTVPMPLAVRPLKPATIPPSGPTTPLPRRATPSSESPSYPYRR